MTVHIPTALRRAAEHVMRRREDEHARRLKYRGTLLTEALTVSVADSRELAPVVAAFSVWVEHTIGYHVRLTQWADGLPTIATIADFLRFAAEDIEEGRFDPQAWLRPLAEVCGE